MSSSFQAIPPSEVLVPFAMMLVLSIIHSQIVSTHSANGCSKKQELLNNGYTRRTKRTRRRNTSVSKIRQTRKCSINYFSIIFSRRDYNRSRSFFVLNLKKRNQLFPQIMRRKYYIFVVLELTPWRNPFEKTSFSWKRLFSS